MPAGARHYGGDFRQGLAGAHRRQRIAGLRGSGGACTAACSWSGSGSVLIGACGSRRRHRGLAGDRIVGPGARRFDGRPGDRSRGVGRIDQRGILAHQPTLAPLHFDQEVDRRLIDHLAAGHADHRTPARVLRELELQAADQSLRALQANPREGGRRCQRHTGVVQLARFIGDDRNLGYQRLPRLGQHPDIAQPQCRGSAAAGHQQQRTYRLYRTHRAPAPMFHGHQYSR